MVLDDKGGEIVYKDSEKTTRERETTMYVIGGEFDIWGEIWIN